MGGLYAFPSTTLPQRITVRVTSRFPVVARMQLDARVSLSLVRILNKAFRPGAGDIASTICNSSGKQKIECSLGPIRECRRRLGRDGFWVSATFSQDADLAA